MQTEKEKIRLLMNSDKAKEIKQWLLDGMIFDFSFMDLAISIWDSWPFIVIIRKRKN